MKTYLLELAATKARESQARLQDIRNILNKPIASLQSYVAHVNELADCRQQKDQLNDQKKKLDEMKAVLSKNRSKDEGGYQSVS